MTEKKDLTRHELLTYVKAMKINVPDHMLKKTVCAFFLDDKCIKGDNCGYLHRYDEDKLPACKFFMQYGECNKAKCLFKHPTEPEQNA
jgi:hypothetical protein